MRLAFTLDHMADPRDAIALAERLERAGCDEVWVPETWGFDAPSLMGAIAARTERIGIGAVLPVYTRTPALIAQTAAGVDAISGGRAHLGLGASGPQVIEGWHGVPFERSLGELREVVEACRTAWRREVLVARGPRPIPLPPGRGTGLGRPLRMITQPLRESVPICLAAMAPGAVRLAAELADQWWPLFATASSLGGHWAQVLASGGARRDPSLGPLGITVSVVAGVGDGDDIGIARAAARREIAFYVGSMGSRERNFYADAVSSMGFAAEAEAIQDAALSGRRRDAEALVPDQMVDELALIGTPQHVRDRLADLRVAGVTMVALSPATPDPVGTTTLLRALVDETDSGVRIPAHG